MKNKRIVLFCLIILLTGVIYFAVQALQKNGNQRANFSGEWKSKESISMGGNIVCTFVEGDRMLATTMKIAEQPGFLTIEASSSFPDTGPVTSKEKLTFDGKTSEIDHSPGGGKKFTVKLSADRQTMTVNTVVQFMVPTPSHVDVMKQAVVNVTEVWKLSNDGKSITVQANAKSNLFDKGRSWTTVFNKAS